MKGGYITGYYLAKAMETKVHTRIKSMNSVGYGCRRIDIFLFVLNPLKKEITNKRSMEITVVHTNVIL